MRLRATQHHRSGRPGSAALELVLVLPVIVVLLMGVVEYSLLLTARQQLLAACREGARVAAHGGSDQEVEDATKRVLGDGRLGDAEVKINRVEEDPQHAEVGRDRVEVCVQVAATHVVPDLLGWIGISFRDRDLIACCVMSKE